MTQGYRTPARRSRRLDMNRLNFRMPRRRHPRDPRVGGGVGGMPGLSRDRDRALRPVAALGRAAALVEAQVDELSRDARVGEAVDGVAREIGRKLDQREVLADLDGTEVVAAQAALVGQGADDLAGFDALTATDGDAVGREASATAATVAPVAAVAGGTIAGRGRTAAVGSSPLRAGAGCRPARPPRGRRPRRPRARRGARRNAPPRRGRSRSRRCPRAPR